MKIALISETLPPSGTGQATVIRRMLDGLDPSRYCLVSNRRYTDAEGSSAKLPGEYHHLPEGFQLTRGYRFGLARLRRLVNVPLSVAQQTRRLVELIRRERCEAVVACTGELTHLPAGYFAGRRLGLPFYAYVFDDYSYREWADPAAAFWARRFEPTVMKNAAGVIAPNEVLRDDLRRRYGIEATVIHNSFDITPYESLNGDAAASRADGELRIVYTGDIYEAHYDAFRNLLRALEGMGRAARLHVYTSRPIDELEQYGIRGPIVRHPYRSQAEIPRVQREADLLFLPLAFDSPYPDLVRTSATTKLGEYLAAGTPVLAHAPADSFVAWYFRRHGCGVVVDRPEVGLLAEAIETTLGDAELRRQLCARAWQCARDDFSIVRAREMFWRLLGVK
jgi:glycosyltransferase involved in cell wall biosynthesis